MLNQQILPFIQIIFLAEPCHATENMQLFGKSMQGWDGLGSAVAVYDQITVYKGGKIWILDTSIGQVRDKTILATLKIPASSKTTKIEFI